MAIGQLINPLTQNNWSLGAWLTYDAAYLLAMIVISFVTHKILGFVRLILPGYVILYCGPRALLVNASNALKISQSPLVNRADADPIFLNILIAIAMIIVAFGLVLHMAGLKNGEPTHENVSRFDAVYFSAITWSTVGYGDISPASRAAKILVAIEALFGYLMLGLLATQFPGLGAAIGSSLIGH